MHSHYTMKRTRHTLFFPTALTNPKRHVRSVTYASVAPAAWTLELLSSHQAGYTDTTRRGKAAARDHHSPAEHSVRPSLTWIAQQKNVLHLRHLTNHRFSTKQQLLHPHH